MKSNRAARRLFGAFGKISNTRRITLRVLNDHWSYWRAISIDQIKPTRSQKRGKRRVAAIVAWANGQHTQGERD